MIRIGILSLQGSVVEHINMLNRIEGVQPVVVKYKKQLGEIDGLIIPGGESTAIGKLMRDFDLLEPLRDKIQAGLPVWGTCAGLILLAKQLNGEVSDRLAVMDINANRNAYGTQIDSFIASECISDVSSKPITMIFIRAPYIIDVGDNVQVLKELDGKIIAARQRNMVVTAFHPELTEDISFHEYFVSIIAKK